MRLLRLFSPTSLQTLKLPVEVELSEDAHQHIVKVLRKDVGTQVVLFDNSGYSFTGELSRIEKKRSFVRLTDKQAATNESPLHIHLVQGISRGDRMEWLLEKAVELGVHEITPLITEHSSSKKFSNDVLQKWQQKWQKQVISACEQCWRNTVPTVHAPQTFQDWLNVLPVPTAGQAYLNLYPYNGHKLTHLASDINSIVLIVGPEGGLSAAEVQLLHAKGFQNYQAGPRILRTETAGIAVIAILQAHLGDF